MPEWERLRQWSRQVAGLTLRDDAITQLQRYVEVLRLWNRKVALVSRADMAVILDRHVADSLFAAAHCGDVGPVADLGSGAGFPGLVVAIIRPSLRVVLIEARGKKVSFLEEACRVAPIRNAQPIQGRIEAISDSPRHRHAYRLIMSRALADLQVLRQMAEPLAAPGATLLAMRAATAPVPPGGRRIDYELPDGTPRALVTIEL